MHHGQTRLRTPLERALHYKILRRDEILATAAALEHAFSVLYPVNAYHPPYLGTAIGRYPEDNYDGYASGSAGNPWFLATTAFAELYYHVVRHWSLSGKVTVNKINAPFFDQWPVGTVFHAGTTEFDALLKEMTMAGNRFMATVQYHQMPNGSLSLNNIVDARVTKLAHAI